jgi:hypothetical protein
VGDSDFAVQLSALAIILIVVSIAVFVIAWRVRKRAVRLSIGVLLLVLAVTCGFFSTLAVLLIAVLGVSALVLAFKTR